MSSLQRHQFTLLLFLLLCFALLIAFRFLRLPQ